MNLSEDRAGRFQVACEESELGIELAVRGGRRFGLLAGAFLVATVGHDSAHLVSVGSRFGSIE